MMTRLSVISIAAVLVGLTGCGGTYSNTIQGSYGSAFSRGIKAWSVNDDKRAADEFAFAVKSGHPRAEVAYGQLFARGRGVEADPVRAQALFESAYGKSSSVKSRAAYELGILLLDGGEGPSGAVVPNPLRARDLLVAALDGGETRAASRLGRMYQEGEGVDTDIDEAITYYELVAEEDATAAVRLATLLAETGADENEVDDAADQAIELLEARAEDGNERSWIQLSDIYSRGEIVEADPERAIAYLENLSAVDDPAVLMRLATLHERTGDTKMHKDMLILAANAGDVRAQTQLARLFLKAGTADTNGVVGRDYAQRAIAQRSTAAMVYLAQALLRGEVLPRDPVGGESLLRRASDAGHPGAARALGSAILKGDVPSRRPDEGRLLLENSANEGSASAMSTLGFSYLSGRGLPKDETLALQWIRRAAEAGNQRARDYLAENNDV